MDPISSKLTQTALTNLNGIGSPLPAEKTYSNDKSGFANMLDTAMGGANHSTQASNAKLLEFVDTLSGEGGGVKEISAADIKVDMTRAAEVEGVGGNKAGILEMFKEVNNNQVNMDQLIENMMSGFGKKQMSAQEAFRVQVFAQMHSVHMEVISKVGEMANKSITTPFNMQVG